MRPEMGWALLRVTNQPAAHSSPSRGQATPDNRLVSETPLTAPQPATESSVSPRPWGSCAAQHLCY